MSDRLTSLDASFLYLEEPRTAMHVGSVMVFDAPDGGFDYDRLVCIISRRIAYIPRYRQRVRFVPGRLANPVWIDDERFDVTYHVRRSALPRPGDDEQLEELIARIQPRQLDRSRPLWEVYLVEGLADDRFAIITKTHQALVDGVNAVDIAHLILEDSETASPESVDDTWRPSREPSQTELIVSALADNVRAPGQVVETVQTGITDVKATAGRVLGVAGELAAAGAVFDECVMCNLCTLACPEHIRPNHLGLFVRRMMAAHTLRPANLMRRLQEIERGEVAIDFDAAGARPPR